MYITAGIIKTQIMQVNQHCEGQILSFFLYSVYPSILLFFFFFTYGFAFIFPLYISGSQESEKVR